MSQTSASRSGIEERRVLRLQRLASALEMIPPGRKGWPRYQELIKRILTHLFHPEIERSEYELQGNDGADRRDIIFENRSRKGFWVDIRKRYRGEYPVFDAKNLNVQLAKKEVLSLAHYLKPYGCGMFGGLVIRGGGRARKLLCQKGAVDQSRKMIIVLNDKDIIEMINRKTDRQDVSYYLARKIAEFRMSL